MTLNSMYMYYLVQWCREVSRRLLIFLLQMKSMIAVMMFAGVALAAPGGYTGRTKHFSKIIFSHNYNWMQAMGGFTRTWTRARITWITPSLLPRWPSTCLRTSPSISRRRPVLPVRLSTSQPSSPASLSSLWLPRSTTRGRDLAGTPTTARSVRLLLSVVFLHIFIFRPTIYPSSITSTGPRPSTSPTRIIPIIPSKTRLNNIIIYLFINLFIIFPSNRIFISFHLFSKFGLYRNCSKKKLSFPLIRRYLSWSPDFLSMKKRTSVERKDRKIFYCLWNDFMVDEKAAVISFTILIIKLS